MEQFVQTAEGFLGYSILQEEFSDLLENDHQGDFSKISLHKTTDKA